MNSARRQTDAGLRHQHFAAFTLLELLIAISIMLILLAITVTAIRVNNEADKVRGAGRALQSFLMGAKDRAIYAKSPRGVRLLLASGDNRTVSGMVYIEPTEPWRGNVVVEPVDGIPGNYSPSNLMRRVRMRDPDQAPTWADLTDAGLLAPGLRMRIPANDRGTWYVIQNILSSGTARELLLTTEIRNPHPSGTLNEAAEIELPPSAIENAEAVQLTQGVVIDLDRSGYWQPNPSPTFTPKFPFGWVDSSGNYIHRMDIMFSPRGTVIGPSAGAGVIQLYLTDQTAAELNLDPGFKDNPTGAALLPSGIDPTTAIPDKFLVSIFTRTGNVTVTPVQTTDLANNSTGVMTPDGYADDPFYFSERGEVAGK